MCGDREARSRDGDAVLGVAGEAAHESNATVRLRSSPAVGDEGADERSHLGWCCRWIAPPSGVDLDVPPAHRSNIVGSPAPASEHQLVSFLARDSTAAASSRQCRAALLGYTVSKGPELSHPMDPSSEATGKTTFVIVEVYESPADIARHRQDAMATWPDMTSAVQAWADKASIVTLHNGTVVQSLW
jgi:quinol monooxygenase YgiN